MKLKCDKLKLIEVINTVQRAISSKSTMPVLECIKIESKDMSNIIMTGSNNDMRIEYNLQCNVMEGGSTALASKMFGEIIRRMPDGEVYIEVNESSGITKIKGGLSEFNIQGQDTSSYPETPELHEKFRFKIEEGKLKGLIRKTLPFIALNDGKRPILTGTLFDIKNNYLNLATTDSHRIAVVKEELRETIDDAKLIVPGSAMRELIKILHDGENQINIIAGERRMLADFGDFRFYTSLMEGEFLRYDAIISAVNSINITLNKKKFTDSLERAMLLINEDMSASTENKVPVKLIMAYDKMDISCITGKGQVSDTLNAEIEGGDLTIGFNCRFLLDAMNVCDDDPIYMEFSTPTSGCFIKPASGDDSFVYMILPVRLYN